jgi:hypothetical protein
MKKTFITPQQEVLDTHIISVQDNVENAFQMVLRDFMESTDGVLFGLNWVDATQVSDTMAEVTFSNGAIIKDGIFSTHKQTSENKAFLPLSESITTYMISAYSEVVETDLEYVYRLTDVSTRTEELVIRPNSKESVVKFRVTAGGYNSMPSGDTPLFLVQNLDSPQESLTDFRKPSEIVRFRKGLQLGFKGLFYGSM